MFTYRTMTELLQAEARVKQINIAWNKEYARVMNCGHPVDQDTAYEMCCMTAHVLEAFDVAAIDLHDLGFREDVEEAA